MDDEQVLMPEAAHRFATDVLPGRRMPSGDPAVFSDSMVWAALRGPMTEGLTPARPAREAGPGRAFRSCS